MVPTAIFQTWATASVPPCYRCGAPLSLYKAPDLKGLVTQATAGRHLEVLAFSEPQGLGRTGAVSVRLQEDGYPGWIAAADLEHLQSTAQGYQPTPLDRAAIVDRLPQVLAFAQAALAQPNTYLWGGTLGPNYDCSGLMQAAFRQGGIWLPRDSYQQESFTEPLAWDALEPGDLVFFGTPQRTTHVGLYVGAGRYLHSSGVDQGRNGIGIDSLTDLSDPISAAYHRQRRRPGRVMVSYCPTMPLPWRD